MGVYIVKEVNVVKDIGVVLEGSVVLEGMDNVALATALLFGLVYALNLSYPTSLRYTFEVIHSFCLSFLSLNSASPRSTCCLFTFARPSTWPPRPRM